MIDNSTRQAAKAARFTQHKSIQLFVTTHHIGHDRIIDRDTLAVIEFLGRKLRLSEKSGRRFRLNHCTSRVCTANNEGRMQQCLSLNGTGARSSEPLKFALQPFSGIDGE
jgi:hypothetical protein